MFLKYRIMKTLKFDEVISLEDLYTEIYASPKTEKKLKRFGQIIVLLNHNGFVTKDNDGMVSLRSYSSFYEYKIAVRKSFFDFSVSLSAITVAITSVLGLLL